MQRHRLALVVVVSWNARLIYTNSRCKHRSGYSQPYSHECQHQYIYILFMWHGSGGRLASYAQGTSPQTREDVPRRGTGTDPPPVVARRPRQVGAWEQRDSVMKHALKRGVTKKKKKLNFFRFTLLLGDSIRGT